MEVSTDRLIKFRLWSEKDQKYKDFESFTITTNGIDSEIYDKSDGNKLVLEQYTGLKDKNGVEIYEGDRVQECEEEYMPATGTVRWNKKYGGFLIYWDEPYHQPSLLTPQTLRVVGNIHACDKVTDKVSDKVKLDKFAEQMNESGYDETLRKLGEDARRTCENDG